jgi:hypothetical protein
MVNKEILFNWVFGYNPYRDQWMTTDRNHYTELYSGGKNVLFSKDINTLIDIIIKTDGDVSKVDKLVDK